jgi:hypothetical protein
MRTAVLAIFIVVLLRWASWIDKLAEIEEDTDICARIRMARLKAGLPPEPEDD